MTGIEVALIVGAMSAAMSVHQAQQQNKAAKMSMNSATANAKRRYEHLQTAKKQKTDSAMAARDVEALKMRNKAARVAGRVKVAQAEGGMSTFSGSGEGMMAQVERDEAFNQDLLSQNTGNMLDRISSDFNAGNIETQGTYESQIATAMSQTQSPFLSGLSGAISGVGTGLSMHGAGDANASGSWMT